MQAKPNLPTVLLRTQSDARLSALARQGHERAFEAIVERYRKPLQARCRRILPPDRAEDAVQQTFLKTWVKLRDGTEIRDVRAWLYRVALNTSLNALRMQGYDYAELNESLARLDATESDLERRVVMRETLAAVGTLPEGQREALLQTAVQGRSHTEVAQELGISDGAVRMLVHRARASLRAAATVVTPMPFATWLATLGAGSGGEPARRIAELALGGGSAGLAAALTKGGAVVVTVAAIATPLAVVESGRDSGPDTAAAGTVKQSGDEAGTHADASTGTGGGDSGAGALGREATGARSEQNGSGRGEGDRDDRERSDGDGNADRGDDHERADRDDGAEDRGRGRSRDREPDEDADDPPDAPEAPAAPEPPEAPETSSRDADTPVLPETDD